MNECNRKLFTGAFYTRNELLMKFKLVQKNGRIVWVCVNLLKGDSLMWTSTDQIFFNFTYGLFCFIYTRGFNEHFVKLLISYELKGSDPKWIHKLIRKPCHSVRGKKKWRLINGRRISLRLWKRVRCSGWAALFCKIFLLMEFCRCR